MFEKMRVRVLFIVLVVCFPAGVIFHAGPLMAEDFSTEDCLGCHGDDSLTKTLESGEELSLFVDLKKLEASLHGGLSCADCHADIEDLPHEEDLKKGQCGLCHSDIEEEYLTGIHGMAYKRGEEFAPYCSDCHGYHDILPPSDEKSMVFRTNLQKTCASCHESPEVAKKYKILLPEHFRAYSRSVHYQEVMKGNEDSALCVDCHASHALKPPYNPDSLVNHFNIPDTCGKCHGEVAKVYRESVHGEAVLEAYSTDSPVCTDCHREHAVQRTEDPDSPVYDTAVTRETCAPCHEAEPIMTKYGISTGNVASYFKSYHGLADRAGTMTTANCASCHGYHDIRSSGDPASSVHKANLTETCGKCHPGVTENVAKGSIHLAPSPKRDRLVYWIRWIYVVLLIPGTIGLMIVHNAFDFFKKIRARWRGTEFPHHEGASAATFVRLTLNERIQHLLLFVSFTLLAISGFALMYPEAWWVRPLVSWEGGFAFRGLVHRVAAVVFIAAGIYHVYYVLFTRDGRRMIIALLPRLKDVRDVMQVIRYFLGLSDERPAFARYGYIEKMEYWALIWGGIVMTVTGCLLWFNNMAMRFFPLWVLDVSTVIHLYEAILATLAIIVWHFYYVFLNPDIYPMNFACITGKITEEEMRKEHLAEYEELKAKGEMEA